MGIWKGEGVEAGRAEEIGDEVPKSLVQRAFTLATPLPSMHYAPSSPPTSMHPGGQLEEYLLPAITAQRGGVVSLLRIVKILTLV